VKLEQLSWMDNSFLLGEAPRTPGHFCPVLIYDRSTAPSGDVGIVDIKDTVRARLTTDPTFRRKLVTVPLNLDRPYWMSDAEFELDEHIHRVVLPPPAGWREFCDVVCEIHSRPLDMTKPLWELTMIDGIDNVEGLAPNTFALMFKIHHAAVDGVSGVRMLTSLHDASPEAAYDLGPDNWQPDVRPSTVELLGRAALHGVTHPVHSVAAISRHVALLRRAPSLLTKRPSPPERLPRTRFNRKLGRGRVFDAHRFTLDEIKQVKNKVAGATVNDAALALIAGAMRRYLDELGELPPTSLTAAVPVSTRTAEQLASGGNQISMMRTPIFTDIADPIQRLRAISDATNAAKEVQQGVSTAVMQDLAQATPGLLIGLAMKAAGTLPFNGPVLAHTGVTNVPGSRVPLYLAGAELDWFTGCTPLWDGMTFMHTVGSYRDDFSVQITSCPESMPDTRPYMAALRDSMRELLQADPEIA
jgi:diacylglycerol O-acyltransferase / wax synthase